VDPTKSFRDNLPKPDETIIEADIWCRDSNELHDLAETIVNRHPRFAWLIVDAWLTRHEQLLLDKK